MPTKIEVQVTPEGLLIPRAAIHEWLEGGIEVVKEEARIVIQPRPAPLTERERVLQILGEAGLSLPPEPLPSDHKPVSLEEQAELARKFSVGRPLSEMVIEEREDRA